MGEGLDGLAEAHVVGKDAAEAVPAEELEPSEALELVGAEVAFKGFGRFYRGNLVERGEAAP